jgi:hypothetical protein
MLARQWSRRWVPDDPVFPYDAARPGYQWHLRNTGENGATTGIDLNVVPAWDTFPGLVTATGPLTTWIDRNTANKPRRFYRVVMP